MAEFTKGLALKERFADKMVYCDTHFENDQLVAVLDICDELGIPDMYEALKALCECHQRINEAESLGHKALSKAEGKLT